MKRKLKLQHEHTREAEKLSPISYTVPDDAFTIAELFNRYQKGQPIPVGLERPTTYSDNPQHFDLDLSKVQHLDIAEVQQLHIRMSENKAQLEKRLIELNNAKNDDKTTNNATNTPAA